MLCADAALRGYFGFTARGARLLEDYPYGGLCEFLTASPQSLVKLPPAVTFEQGARFGYLGTSFAALRLGGAGGGKLDRDQRRHRHARRRRGMLALAMGVTRILGWGRNRAVLEQLKALAPRRIDMIALGDQPVAAWLKERTEGLGVDLLLDAAAAAPRPHPWPRRRPG